MIRIGVLAAVVAAVILAASSASGQVTRAFVASISPSTGIAGGATTTYTLTITNCPGSPCDSQYSSQQSLGSANVTAPYPITSISGLVTCPVPLPNKGAPCATLASPTSILLRNLNVAPGASASVSFEATAPCSGGPYSWSAAAKSTGDFNGADFQLVTPSTLTTTLGSVCTLAFDDQPAGTVVNTTITSSAYDSSAGPVTVKVLDGNGNPLTAGTYPVTIGLAPCAPDPTSLLACGTGSLSSGSNTFTTNTSTSSGIVEASFGDLSITDIGTYELGASSTALPASSAATSSSFGIMQTGKICSNGSQCVLTTSAASGTTTTLDLDSNGHGTAGLSLVKNAPYTCGTYTQVHGSAAVANIVGSDFGTGKITLTTPHDLAPGTGVGGFTICLTSVLPFTTADGTAAAHVGNFYVGTIPSCGPQAQVPCIVSKNRSVTSADLIITFLIAPGDPAWYD